MLAMSSTVADRPLLSPVFGNHMVVQRDRPSVFWGWDQPGATVRVDWAGRQAKATAASDGKWMVRIDPPKTGGPYQLSVVGSAGTVSLSDILVGDVWICSGQSNMEMGVSMVNDAQKEIQAANHPTLRLFLGLRGMGLSPLPLVAGSWALCTPQNIAQGGWGGFPATAYFFGRELNEKLDVPIGLVATSWGGTAGEAWVPRAELEKIGDWKPQFQTIDERLKPGAEAESVIVERWFGKNDPLSAAHAESEQYDDSAWKSIAGPNTYPAMGVKDHPGVVWLRGEFDLKSEPNASEEIVLSVGSAWDTCSVWLNGKYVGTSNNGLIWQQYKVLGSAMRAGRNRVAIRLLSGNGGGGVGSGPDNVVVYRPSGPVKIGNWKLGVGATLKQTGPFPMVVENNPSAPASLYNAMMHPYAPMAVKGAIWYQGESNVGRAGQYVKILKGMSSGWRQAFENPNMPFYIVQLSSYGNRMVQPGDESWAELRYAQAIAAKEIPNSGLAVTVDIGDAKDIHPKNKQDVGKRLALLALHRTYGKAVVDQGPTFAGQTIDGNKIRLRFTSVGGGLEPKNTDLVGFAVAGSDRKWHWATARIEGDAVVVESAEVAQPVAVRYAWDADPANNLRNREGLPATPFRTDDWPLLSFPKP